MYLMATGTYARICVNPMLGCLRSAIASLTTDTAYW